MQLPRTQIHGFKSQTNEWKAGVGTITKQIWTQTCLFKSQSYRLLSLSQSLLHPRLFLSICCSLLLRSYCTNSSIATLNVGSGRQPQLKNLGIKQGWRNKTRTTEVKKEKTEKNQITQNQPHENMKTHTDCKKACYKIKYSRTQNLVLYYEKDMNYVGSTDI